MEDRVILDSDNDDTRRLFESCMQKGKRVVNPIVDWENKDVWEFIRDEKIPVNPLYEHGWCRVGCIGCPMAGKNRYTEFREYPKYKENYIKAFDRMLQLRQLKLAKNLHLRNGNDVFNWWMEDKTIPGQITLFDEGGNENGLLEQKES